MSRLSLCTGLRRPKVFRDITYFVNNIVDSKLSIDNFCSQTSLLCLEHPFLLYCVILDTTLALDECFNLSLALKTASLSSLLRKRAIIGLGKLLDASS